MVLDNFISIGQLHDGVSDIVKRINEEEKEKYRWEFFLHKVYDKSYGDFLRSVEDNTVESHRMTEEEVKNVVGDSASLLDLF